MRPALVVGGITLGILGLLFLQFAIPYWMGPAGLVAVGVVDVALYLELRHRRAMRRRVRGGNPPAGGPVERHRLTQTKRPLREESLAAIGVVIFVLGLALEVIALHDGSDPAMDFVVLPVGEVMLGIAILTWWPYEWILGWKSESENFDTTDDH